MDETHWQRHLLVGLLALAVATVSLGGIGGILTLRAVELTGIKPATETASKEPAGPAGAAGPKPRPRAPHATEAAQPKPTNPERPRTASNRLITLNATPQSAEAYERVDLTGTYQGEGATTSLQVQRLDGGTWVDFPVSASVDGRTFSTYILTGVVGENRFRVQDGSGQTSNVVTVTIT
ncbi:MAG: hypothetical protein M3423_07490 [Actinomycetota bacterium]|nr:hypothetical protein [Nocardioidaceae bacterium]MDQ3481157.1 hypothetical protein [Actinomycetota bacterium]